MNPDELRQAAAEIEMARGQARKELLVAAAPFGMALVGYLAIRKQRKMVQAALAEMDRERLDAEREEEVRATLDEFPDENVDE